MRLENKSFVDLNADTYIYITGSFVKKVRYVCICKDDCITHISIICLYGLMIDVI